MAKSTTARSTSADLKRRIEALTSELAEARGELDEVRRQQSSTAAILEAISGAPGELQPLLNSIVATAGQLCDAYDGAITLRDGDGLRIAAHHGPIPIDIGARPLVRTMAHGRAVIDRVPVHVHDILASGDKFPLGREAALKYGFRTLLAIPLLRGGQAVGSLLLRRKEVRPFSDKHIALLKTFADQAVIAIAATRLFEEVQARTQEVTEALERQTATSEVLDVISRSPAQLQPVFDAIAKSGARLCNAQICNLFRFDGERLHFVASHGLPARGVEIVRRHYPKAPERTSAAGRALLSGMVAEIPDAEADPDYQREFAVAGMFRGLIAVPMLKDGRPVGAIAVMRSQAGRFPERQIALLRTFADQAVIAIENTRLFEEVQARNRDLTEALEQQTATSEILRIISTSPTDLRPVLMAVAQNAARLCAAEDAHIWQRDGEELRIAASWGPYPSIRRLIGVSRESVVGRAVHDQVPVHVEDLAAVFESEFPDSRAMKEGGNRTVLAIPLPGKGEAMGAIMIRRREVRPFSDAQIALLRTFADQAVIAIENTRLFEEVQARTREVTEALEYQTATSDVLNVISRSPTDAQPVFDTIAQSAARLCDARFCNVFRFDGELLHLAASHGLSHEAVEATRSVYPMAPGRGRAAARSILSGMVEHIPDVHADPDFAHGETATIGNYRSVVAVPMLKDGRPIGTISVMRSQTGHFPDRQIALLRTFADQAVIAIENARLFEEVQTRTRELTEALEFQTATSDVLNVISRSPSQLQPVFEAVIESATRLCGATRGHIFRFDGELLRFAAAHGAWPGFTEYLETHPLRPGAGSVAGRVAAEGRTVQVPDVTAEPGFQHGELLTQQGYRTALAVPMLREGTLLGVIAILKSHVEPFTDKQVELVETFADQAVIAIENARLFEEVQARTRELTEALEQQTATSEVLSVISSSPGELEPVFQTMLENATRLCDAGFGTLYLCEGDASRLVAMHGVPPALARHFLERGPQRPSPLTSLGRVVATKKTVHIVDVRAEQDYFEVPAGFTPPQLSLLAGVRTIVAVPMLKEDVLVGAILIYRQEVQPFTDKQIGLVTSFARQAVIAIENVRLLNELRALTSELTRSVAELKALGEVGQTISSTLDLREVLNAILAHACRLADSGGGAIYVFDAARGEFDLEAGYNMGENLVAAVRSRPIRLGEALVGHCAERREAVQIEDLTQAESHPLFELHVKAGVRALLAVPLLHQDQIVGALVVRRKRTGAFAPEIIALLQSFAAQSAIAIQNARLFHEIEQKSRALEEASRHKSQFVANMSHELRTPLAAMLGYAELLREGIYGALSEKALPVMARIESNGRHLLGLINTVLDISKIESGQFKLNLSDYALAGVVENVRAATESLAAGKKLAYRTEVAAGMPPGLGDEQRLTQVLLNLVGNAIKFTDTGEVCVNASVANGRFTVAVSDTGPGIPASELERVFEQFHQVDNSNTKAKGGTGLGLAISKQIVEMHGGRIWVESSPGHGSTFRMELPVRAAVTGAAA